MYGISREKPPVFNILEVFYFWWINCQYRFFALFLSTALSNEKRTALQSTAFTWIAALTEARDNQVFK